MEKVLDIYKLPYNKDFPVVCMDESPKQLIGEPHGAIRMKPGRQKRVDYDYIRYGVANVFLANEPLRGNRHTSVNNTRNRIDWSTFIKRIADDWYRDAKKITLVMDNLSTHSAAALYDTFPPAEAKRIWDRFDFVYTPVHGSWLNMAEIELHALNRQCLQKNMQSLKQVREEVMAWECNRSNQKTKINWQFTTSDARIKLKKLYPST
jgi:hypothetical protein